MGNLPVSSVAKRAPVGCCRRRFRATPSIQPRSRRELGLFAARRSGGEGLTTRQARSPSPLRLKTAGRHRSAGTDRQRARALHAEDAVSRRHHARDFRTGGLHRATRCAGAEAPRAPDPLSRRVRTGEPRPGTDCAQRARYRLLLAWYFLRRWDEMDATVFASVPFVQLGNNLLHLPGHNGEISLPVAPNVVAASKRDYIAMPVGAFGAAGRLCSPNGYHFVGLSHF